MLHSTRVLLLANMSEFVGWPKQCPSGTICTSTIVAENMSNIGLQKMCVHLG